MFYAVLTFFAKTTSCERIGLFYGKQCKTSETNSFDRNVPPHHPFHWSGFLLTLLETPLKHRLILKTCKTLRITENNGEKEVFLLF